MIDQTIFRTVGGPSLIGVDWVVRYHRPEETLGNACSQWAYEGLTVRWLRGDRMRTVDGVFDEFSAAMQFPWYFGQNWGAFDECLGDLEWIEFSALVIVIFDADQVLVEDPLDMSAFLRGVVGAYEQFAQPIDRGEWWDRPAKPFHVVLQMSEAESHRWLSGLEAIRVDNRGATLSEGGLTLGWLEEIPPTQV